MQPPIPQPGVPQTVMIQSAPTTSSVYPGYQGTKAKIFGIIQIGCGILAIICQGVLISVNSRAAISGAGIWCGIMVCMNMTLQFSTYTQWSIVNQLGNNQ